MTETPAMLTAPMLMHSALTSAIRIAARYAPGMDPIPPTTTTTNASLMTVRSISRLAGSRATCNAPPRPDSSDPKANTPVNSSFSLTPSAPTISRSWVAARMRRPRRVRASIKYSARSTTGPAAIRNRL